MLKKIALLLSLIFAISCGDDNNDIILPEDITNLNREEGVIFGRASQENCNGTNNCNLIYKLTSEGLFLSDNENSLPEDNTWTFFECPLPQVSAVLARDAFNLPRGIRDIQATELTDEKNASGNFFVIEYVTPAGRKTIQFKQADSFLTERIQAYYEYVINTTKILEAKGDQPPMTCP